MNRLSDRAFQLVKNEVDRYYTPAPDSNISQVQNIERIILLARLEALHERSGKSLTPAQLWEEVCDILPQIDRNILKKAGRQKIDTPLIGTSLGLGAASIGAAAVLLANPLSDSPRQTSGVNPLESSASLTKNTTQLRSSHHKSTFETAKAFGWQASLKGQNPPHSAEHWGETAALWQQAIHLLNQVPRYDTSYAIAQAKKVEYQDYLQQIQARQLAAQNLKTVTRPAPQFSQKSRVKTQPKKSALRPRTKVAQAPQTQTVQTPSDQVQTPSPQEAFLNTAKSYGWQASLASQNAPHPVEKWADISRLWQLALQNLNKIEPQHSSYAEAQQIKTQYQQNLAIIRQRYRAEQDANQRFQSLQAALMELDKTQMGISDIKRVQMQAIVSRLNTVPAETIAHQQAQQLIAITNQQIQSLYSAASTQIAISTSEDD